MRFDVGDRQAYGLGQPHEYGNLLFAFIKGLLFAPLQFTPAKVLAIFITGMRPYLHSMAEGQLQGHKNCLPITRVKTTGDVGGSDEWHQLAIEGTAFAKITIEVDFHIAIL